MMNHVSSRPDMLVSGYIRRIKRILSKDTIIPTDIVNICLLFWSYNTKLFINSGVTSMYVLDVETKKLSEIKHIIKKCWNRNCSFDAFCYIKHFPQNSICSNNSKSSSKIDLSKSYDAIMCIQQEFQGWPKCPAFVLFESHKINDDEIYYDSKSIYRSVYKFEHYGTKTFLNCGYKNGIIYQNEGYLYQLKFGGYLDINLIARNFKFKQIRNVSKFGGSLGFSMLYLSKYNKLLAIEQYNYHYDCYMNTHLKSKDMECRIFDFDKCQWTTIDDLKWKTIYNIRGRIDGDQISGDDIYKYECCDNQYDNDVIYGVSNFGHVAIYHFKQNKWETLVDNEINSLHFNILQRDRYLVWMHNNYVLTCCDGTYFGHFDVRDNHRKWIKQNDIINKIPLNTIRGSRYDNVVFK